MGFYPKSPPCIWQTKTVMGWQAFELEANKTNYADKDSKNDSMEVGGRARKKG